MNCENCTRPTRDDAYLCDECCDKMARALGEIPWLDEQLEITIAKIKAAGDAGAASAETMSITPEQRAQWRAEAEALRLGGDLRPLGPRIVWLLDALDAAEATIADQHADLLAGDACGAVGCRALHERDEALRRIDAVLALCARWDGLTHGETGTTRQIRAALRGQESDGRTGGHSGAEIAGDGDSGGLAGHSGASDSNGSEGDPA